MQSHGKNAVLGAWKFLACLMIMGHHSHYFYDTSDYPMHGGYIYVEFFFMVSGYFMMRFLMERLEGKSSETDVKSSLQYVWKKAVSLFPYLLVAVLVQYLLDFLHGAHTFKAAWKLAWKLPLELTYLANMRITTSSVGQLWYVGVMFLVMPLLCFLFVKAKTFFCGIFVWIFPVVWYGYLYTQYARIGNRGQFLDLGRACAGLSLGCLIYMLSKKLTEKNVWGGVRIALTVTFYCGVLLTAALAVRYWGTEYDFLIVLVFAYCLTILLGNQVWQFRGKFFVWLGELSTTVYIVHITIQKEVVRFGAEWSTAKQMLAFYAVTLAYAIALYAAVWLWRRRRRQRGTSMTG